MTQVTPRKVPRQQRAQSTVDAIVAAAADILDVLGWEALSTNAVAVRAGVSIGSLYQYFPGKEAIIAEMVRRERAALLAGLSAVVEAARGRPWMEGIAGLVTIVVDQRISRPRLAIALEYGAHVLPPAADIVALDDEITAQGAALLASFHFDDPHVAARDILALCSGLVTAAALSGETEREHLRQRALRAAWGYINTATSSIRGALR